MPRHHPLRTWLFVAILTLGALFWMLRDLAHQPLTLGDALIGASTLIGLSLAHLHPIKTGNGEIEYTLSTAVLCAALLNLPAGLLLLAVFCSWATWGWKNARRPSKALRALFNAANGGLCAAMAHLFWLRLTPYLEPTQAAMLAAAGFLLLHTLCTAAVIAIDQWLPPHRLPLWERDALVADAIMLLMGVIVGRLLHLDLWLVPLGCLPLLILYQYVGKLHLAKQAFLEPKTGLYNHRYFDTALTMALRRARANGQPVSLVFGDMDYLRNINNSYGHLVGDEAIVAIGQVCKRLARPGDVAVRFGGEEFVLLLPETEKATAAEMAERLRAAVAATTLRGPEYEVSLSMSVGVASFPGDAESEHDLVKRADEAVYAAKHRGRNRVCVYGLDGVSVGKAGSVP